MSKKIFTDQIIKDEIDWAIADELSHEAGKALKKAIKKYQKQGIEIEQLKQTNKVLAYHLDIANTQVSDLRREIEEINSHSINIENENKAAYRQLGLEIEKLRNKLNEAHIKLEAKDSALNAMRVGFTDQDLLKVELEAEQKANNRVMQVLSIIFAPPISVNGEHVMNTSIATGSKNTIGLERY